MTKTIVKERGQQINSYFDLIYLISCALHDEPPKIERVKQMDLFILFHIANYHLLTAIACMGLELTNIFEGYEDVELVKKWKDEKGKSIRKNLMLDIERQEICNFMEDTGIWYLPLKGILLKELYPKSGMRQMADNDILYDRKYQKELLKFMSGRGFTASQIGIGNHDVYQKAPIYNFEMHTALYGDAHERTWVAYYQNVKDRLQKDEHNEWGYHFSGEDFYIYIMSHAYKHYNGGGSGIRFLIDQYVYLQKKGETLNWDYVNEELETLGIAEFEKLSKCLGVKILKERLSASTAFTEKESQMLHYCMNAGAFGTMKNRVNKRLHVVQKNDEPIGRSAKWKYCVERLFPNVEFCRKYYPFYYRHKILIPVLWIYRILRGMTIKYKKIKNEIGLVWKAGR